MTDLRYADAESGVRAWLDDRFPGVRVVTELPNDPNEPLESVLPLILVTRAGGQDRVLTLDYAVLDVETLHNKISGRLQAKTLSIDVWSALRTQLRGHVAADGVFGEPDTLLAPMQVPDPNTNVIRFLATYGVPVHARRGS